MKFRKLTLLSCLAALLLSSCSSVRQTEKANPAVMISQWKQQVAIDNLLRWLDQSSLAAQSMTAEGNLTFQNSETSRNAKFTLNAKRAALLENRNMQRIDSMSIVISGPFGITVAKFLASPQEYALYNAIQGDYYHGKTTAESIAQLTQLQKVPYNELLDVLFGLVPSGDQIDPQDSVSLRSISADLHQLTVRRTRDQIIERLTFKGPLDTLQQDQNAPVNRELTIAQFERWNRDVPDSLLAKRSADISVKYKLPSFYDGVLLPMIVEAHSQDKALILEYTDVKMNPQRMTVWIKMPRL